MELGEKLRQARINAGFSQRQLCGQEITRNMLSQIESGKARPSMTTLQYLAARLDKPISYFLEDGGSPSSAAVENARKSFTQGNYQQALDALGACREKTEEAAYLEFLTLLELGKIANSDGKLPYARQLLQKACAIETIYKTPAMAQEAQLLLLEAGAEGNIPDQERPLLLKAQAALAREDIPAAIRYLDACDCRCSHWSLLRGKAALLTGDYAAALALLKQAEPDYPKQAIPLLETCCKELEDYKQAYYYACLQR